MFQRASKIIITESSSQKRAHPAVGDVGYLNNMYLFFVDQFILLDAFFFSYKSDRKEKKDRCERKRFIIDLGMSKQLKRKLKDYGVPKSFFIKNKYVANLTISGHKVSGAIRAESPNMGSMWYRTLNKKAKSLLGNTVKIPYGQIALAPRRKNSILSDGPGALKCWIECMLPIVGTEILFVPGGTQDTPITNIVNDFYYARLDRYTNIRAVGIGTSIGLRKDVLNRFEYFGSSMHRLIEGLQRAHALSNFLLHNCDMNILTDRSQRMYMDLFSKDWNKYGIKHAYSREGVKIRTRVPVMIIKFVVGFFFRSIIMPGDTESKLLSMNKSDALKWKPSKIAERSKELEDMKRAAEFDSAALNRIFERDLLR